MKLSLSALKSEVPATYVLSGLKPLEARVGEGEIHPPLYTRIPSPQERSVENRMRGLKFPHWKTDIKQSQLHNQVLEVIWAQGTSSKRHVLPEEN
jgi:hypothetical protein